jgi:hypothetical protein
MKIQLMKNCSSSRLRRKALCEDILLDDLKYGRGLECSDHQDRNCTALVNEMQQLCINNNHCCANNPSNPSCYFCGESYPP